MNLNFEQNRKDLFQFNEYRYTNITRKVEQYKRKIIPQSGGAVTNNNTLNNTIIITKTD